jgi:hypothetical protein
MLKLSLDPVLQYYRVYSTMIVQQAMIKTWSAITGEPERRASLR